MDTAGAASVDTTARPAEVPGPPPPGGPSIGVPSIPPVGGRAHPPAPVPSVSDVGAPPVDPVPSGEPVPPGGPQAPAVVPLAPAVAAGTGTDGFPAGVADQLRWYVYLLVDPRTGRPFYVGRGRGDRCFHHVLEARTGGSAGGDRSKYPALDRIRQAESTGREVRVDILRHGMKGSEAALVEGAARDVLGLAGGADAPGHRRAATELGAQLAKRAKFKRPHQVVLLRVGSIGADPSYEVARHGWRIGRRWIDLDSPRSPRWAVVVVGDLVAEVYRIGGWERSPTAGGGPAAGAVDRYSFVGAVDDELASRYRDRNVAAYFGDGAPSQVTYVWCGPHWVNAPH